MSHFAVAVITKNKDQIEKILEPYYEGLEVPRYVEYTKEQLIDKGKKEIQDYKNCVYAEYISNPLKYKENCINSEHIKYLEEEFPKKLNWTNEEIYKDQIRWYDDNDIGKDGEVYSTYNSNSKWDWYEVGGRYKKILLTNVNNNNIFEVEDNPFFDLIMTREINKEAPQGYKWVDGAKIKDIDFSKMEEITKKPFYTWALVDECNWYEQGKMGWWAMNDATEKSKDDFVNQFKKYIELPENQDKYMIIVDCHI